MGERWRERREGGREEREREWEVRERERGNREWGRKRHNRLIVHLNNVFKRRQRDVKVHQSSNPLPTSFFMPQRKCFLLGY